jgi:hypothetical protein
LIDLKTAVRVRIEKRSEVMTNKRDRREFERSKNTAKRVLMIMTINDMSGNKKTVALAASCSTPQGRE